MLVSSEHRRLWTRRHERSSNDRVVAPALADRRGASHRICARTDCSLEATPDDAVVPLRCRLRAVTWPAVALPVTHALLLRRHGKPEQIIQQRRRASALALLNEHSVRSYPSWIAELRCKSPIGVERCRYARDHLGPGEALVLVRERAEADDNHAVSYGHGDVHLGYVPRRHRWIAEAIDDGLRLLAIVETVKTGLVFRQRAKFVGTRIIVLDGGR